MADRRSYRRCIGKRRLIDRRLPLPLKLDLNFRADQVEYRAQIGTALPIKIEIVGADSRRACLRAGVRAVLAIRDDERGLLGREHRLQIGVQLRHVALV